MKCFFNVLCFSFALLFIACNEKPIEEATPVEMKVVEAPRPSNLYKPSPKDTISKATFELWTKNWEKGVGKKPVTKTILYFNMPIVDYAELLGERPVSSRLYLGLDESKLPNVPHLLLVGVDSSGQNMISETDFIYDVTQPCPPACGN